MTPADAGALRTSSGAANRPQDAAPRTTAAGTTTAWPDEPLAAFVTRTWGGCAALGAGLLLTGVGAEHLGAHPVVAAVLLALAAGALGSAVVALRGGAAHLPRAAVVLALAGGAAAASGLATQRFGAAELTASALGVLGAVLLGASGHVTGTGDDRRAEHGATRLVLLVLGALAVAAACTTGLAATEAGDHAVSHGLHVHHG